MNLKGSECINVGTTHVANQLETSYCRSKQSDLEAEDSLVDIPIDLVDCIDETVTGLVSLNRSYLYSWYVSRPLTCYR